MRPLRKVAATQSCQSLRRGFGTEHLLEARACELHAHDAFALFHPNADVHHAPLGLKIFVDPSRGITLCRNANLQFRADGHVEARAERGSASANIFAGSIFFKGEAARIAALHPQRQADGDSTFGPLSRSSLAALAHGWWAPHSRLYTRRSVRRSRPLPRGCAPYARFCAVRCRSQCRAKTSMRTASFFPRRRANPPEEFAGSSRIVTGGDAL